MPQYNGVWTLEAQAQAQSNQQWVTDPNFKNTTLLLQADGTGSGSQNQSFIDGSTNNFFIARFGNTTQGSFSPFSQAPGYWSNYFNGSSSLAAPANTLDFIHQCTANWTIEFWFNASSTANQVILTTTTTGSLQIGFFVVLSNRATGDIEIQISRGSGGNVYAVYTNGSAWVPNTWNHAAFTFNTTGTAFAIFINGVQQTVNTAGTATFSGSNASGVPTIGSTTNNILYYTGYLSNLRTVNGTRVYTSNFTPQTTPLTAVTNTSLLTCQSNRFVDNSTNNYAITTASGTPSVQAFGPFAPALQWTPDVVGGSGYFDGTSDYLRLASNANLNPSISSYTFEFWFYRTTSGAMTVFLNDVNTGFYVHINSSNFLVLRSAFVADIITSSITMPVNAWVNVVIARGAANSTKMWINGSSANGGSATDSTTYVQGTTYIGAYQGSSIYFTGYIAGMRLVKGSDVYGVSNSTITVPTTPPTAITNTQLLLNYTNAGIYDGAMANNLETVGNAQVSTSPVKYGSGSMYFDGSGDYLVARSSPLAALGTADFTVEFWIWINALPASSAYTTYFSTRTGGTGMDIQVFNSAGTYQFMVGNPTGAIISANNVLSTSTWTHIAATRQNGFFRLFVNGIVVASGASSQNFTDTGCYVACGVSGGNQTNCYIDDLRVTNGVSRYNANFTPPQQALPRQ